MDKTEFVADKDRLWLLESADPDVDNLRAELGKSIGFQEREWYKNDIQLNKFLDTIDKREDKEQFFYKLKEVASSPEQQKTLLSGVVTEFNTAPAPPPPAPTQGTGDTGQPVATSRGAAPTATAPPRKSSFKSGPKQESADPASGGSSQVSPEKAPAAPPPPPQRASIFKAKKTEPAAGSDETVAAGPGQDGAETPPNVEEVQAEIDAVVSDLSADEFADLAEEVSISPDDLRAMMQEPDFAAMVAEELAKLE
jgi:hypothetical protein